MQGSRLWGAHTVQGAHAVQGAHPGVRTRTVPPTRVPHLRPYRAQALHAAEANRLKLEKQALEEERDEVGVESRVECVMATSRTGTARRCTLPARVLPATCVLRVRPPGELLGSGRGQEGL